MSTVVPMFPLPGVFLFPGQVMPLHVFEPRYRQMVDDLLDGPGRLVVGTLLEGESETEDHVPAVLPVAGLGEIARHNRLEDGRYLILLYGIGRVRLTETDSDRLYRRVEVEPVDEAAAPDLEADRLRPPLIDAIHDRTGVEVESLEDVATGQLADVLAQCLRIPQERMEQIFVDPDAVNRAERVLAAHAEFPSA